MEELQAVTRSGRQAGPSCSVPCIGEPISDGSGCGAWPEGRGARESHGEVSDHALCTVPGYGLPQETVMILGRAEKFLSCNAWKGRERGSVPLNPTVTPFPVGLLTSGKMCAKHLRATPLVSIMVSCLVTQTAHNMGRARAGLLPS